MLEIYDHVGEGHSHSYLGYEFAVRSRSEIRFSCNLKIRKYPIRDICIALVRGEDKSFSGLFLGPNGELKLQDWHYRHFPILDKYPSPGIFPKGTMRSFPTLIRYPSSDDLEVESYPNQGDPKEKIVLKNSQGGIYLDFTLRGLGSYLGESSVYAEKINANGRRITGSAYGTMLNWHRRNTLYFLFGVISAQDTSYHVIVENPKLEGEIFEENWYHIEGYDGFALHPLDEPIKWQGARRIGDHSTYSNYTTLKSLSRYDYARPTQLPVGSPQGIRWQLLPEEQ